MKFETREARHCAGWQLAHSVTVGSKRFPKTHTLSRDDIKKLASDGTTSLQVFQLEDGDITEDEAALSAAVHIAGKGLRAMPVGKGRANLIAATDGLFCSGGAIAALNALNDAFSVASVPENVTVQAGQLVATIKMVPYAVPADTLSPLNASNTRSEVTPFQPYKAALITTDLNLSDKIISVIKLRLAQTGGTLSSFHSCPHTEQDITQLLRQTVSSDLDVVLIMGVSAITDVRDVVPAAAKAAGADLIKVGLPTDPGNLLMLAKHDNTHVIGLPGCAKSPALNGLDWVLARIAARMPIDHSTLTSFGVGGLLKEPKDRPNKRSNTRQTDPETEVTSAKTPRLQTVILAAGRSTRSGAQHKLLSRIDGHCVIEKTVQSIMTGLDHSGLGAAVPVIVTGHRADAIEAALADYEVQLLHNPGYADGMGTSIAVSVRTAPEDTEWLMVCLGDMPFIAPSTIKALLERAGQAPASVIMPTFHGKRGHPVIWHKKYFLALSGLSGDAGGKALFQNEELDIQTVPVQDPGILIDLDTPEMLTHFGAVTD